MVYTKGILLKLLNITLFTTMSVLSALIGSAVHKLQVFWMICGFALLIISMLIFMSRKQPTIYITRESFFWFVLRSLCNVLGMWTWLEAITAIGANTSVAISYMTPIFTAILAIVLLKEKMPISCGIAIVISFTGLCVIFKPDGVGVISYGGGMALLSCLMWAMHDIICKKQTIGEHHLVQAWYVFLLSMLISAPPALLLWQAMTSMEMMIIAMIGCVSAANIVVVFLAYRAAPITILMPFSYCKFLFMATAAYCLLHEDVLPHTALGAMIIATASLYIFYQQHKGKLTRGT